MSTDVRRGTGRFLTHGPGRVTHHSFSFGPHYDPANLGLGPLVCHDDHELGPGAGFPTHRHTDLEIVTWVVAGELVHDGSSSLRPGQVAVQSAGSGIEHSEVAGEVPTRFVQAWLRPDRAGLAPARSVADVVPEPGALTPLVGPGAPLAVAVAGAALGVARVPAGERLELPAAPLSHAYVVDGALVTGPRGPLVAGDALRLTDQRLVLEAREDTGAEVMVWAFH